MSSDPVVHPHRRLPSRAPRPARASWRHPAVRRDAAPTAPTTPSSPTPPSAPNAPAAPSSPETPAAPSASSVLPARPRRARALVAWATRGGGDAGAHGIEVLGRVGLVAYGVLHLLLAGLGVALLVGTRGVRADQEGAIAVVAGIGPAGAALLGLAIVALAAFGAWQTRAALVGFRWVAGGERLRKRVGAAGKAIAMFSVAVVAFPPAIGPLVGPPPGGPPPPEARPKVSDTVATMLDLPAGRVLVGAVAVVAVVMGVCMSYTACFATYLGDLHIHRLDHRWRRVAIGAGSYGNLARGVLFGSIGVLFGAAAITGDPTRSGGLTRAMRFIERGPWGVAGLAVIVAGVAAFGVYCFIDAYARRA